MKKAAFLSCLILFGAGTAQAESASSEEETDVVSFTHHIDLFQVGSVDGHVKTYDFAYHFTVLEIGRVNLLGAGLGLDVWGECHTNRCSLDSSDHKILGSPYFVGALGSVRLSGKGDGGWLSLGANYVYHLRDDNHALIGGFMISWQ